MFLTATELVLRYEDGIQRWAAEVEPILKRWIDGTLLNMALYEYETARVNRDAE